MTGFKVAAESFINSFNRQTEQLDRPVNGFDDNKDIHTKETSSFNGLKNL